MIMRHVGRQNLSSAIEPSRSHRCHFAALHVTCSPVPNTESSCADLGESAPWVQVIFSLMGPKRTINYASGDLLGEAPAARFVVDIDASTPRKCQLRAQVCPGSNHSSSDGSSGSASASFDEEDAKHIDKGCAAAAADDDSSVRRASNISMVQPSEISTCFTEAPLVQTVDSSNSSPV